MRAAYTELVDFPDALSWSSNGSVIVPRALYLKTMGLDWGIGHIAHHRMRAHS